MRPRGPQPLTPGQQLLLLRGRCGADGAGSLKRGRLIWDFDARPAPLSRCYRMRICYRLAKPPEVFVRSPHLPTLAGDRELPHVYHQDPPRLCLYLPSNGEWSTTMRISDTIVPWSVLWLYYFEDWLATDEWLGGGVHPEARDARG